MNYYKMFMCMAIIVSMGGTGCIDNDVSVYHCEAANSTLYLYSDGTFLAKQDSPIEGVWYKDGGYNGIYVGNYDGNYDGEYYCLTSSVFSWRLFELDSTTLLDEEGDYWYRI